MLEGYITNTLKILTFAGISMNFLHHKQAKMSRLALGIVLISAIMLPIVDIISPKEGFDNDDFFDAIEQQEVNDSLLESFFEDGIEKYIASEYAIDEEEIKVSVDGFDISTMTASAVYVSIPLKGATVDYKSLAARIEREFTDGGVCRVDFDIG